MTKRIRGELFKMENQHRYLEIDIIRFCGILLVLIGHSNILHQGEHGGEWFIALFHVAIFYIAAGFVYKDAYEDSIRSIFVYVKRRIRSLYIPFVIINFPMEVLFEFKTHNIEMLKIIKILLMIETSDFAATSWFVIAIFYISILFALNSYLLTKKLGNKKLKMAIHFLISIGFLTVGFLLNRYLSRQLLWILYGYIMFYLGNFMRIFLDIMDYKHGFVLGNSGTLRGGIILANGILLVVSFLILMACKNWRTLSLSDNRIIHPAYYIFVSIEGWILLYSLSIFLIKFSSAWIINLFSMIGQSSLFILLLHIQIWRYILNPLFAIIFKTEIKSYEQFSQTPYGIIYIFVGLSIPMFIYYYLYKPFDEKIKKFS